VFDAMIAALPQAAARGTEQAPPPGLPAASGAAPDFAATLATALTAQAGAEAAKPASGPFHEAPAPAAAHPRTPPAAPNPAGGTPPVAGASPPGSTLSQPLAPVATPPEPRLPPELPDRDGPARQAGGADGGSADAPMPSDTGTQSTPPADAAAPTASPAPAPAAPLAVPVAPPPSAAAAPADQAAHAVAATSPAFADPPRGRRVPPVAQLRPDLAWQATAPAPSPAPAAAASATPAPDQAAEAGRGQRMPPPGVAEDRAPEAPHPVPATALPAAQPSAGPAGATRDRAPATLPDAPPRGVALPVAAFVASPPDASAEGGAPAASADPPRAAPPPASPREQPAMGFSSDPARQALELRLDTPDLGAIEVEVREADGAAEVVVRSDRADTLAALARDGAELDRALRDAGIGPDGRSMSFLLAGRDGRPDQRQRGPGARLAPPEPLPAAAGAAPRGAGLSLLDIHV
jgi:hypothetical protein